MDYYYKLAIIAKPENKYIIKKFTDSDLLDEGKIAGKIREIHDISPQEIGSKYENVFKITIMMDNVPIFDSNLALDGSIKFGFTDVIDYAKKIAQID